MFRAKQCLLTHRRPLCRNGANFQTLKQTCPERMLWLPSPQVRWSSVHRPRRNILSFLPLFCVFDAVPIKRHGISLTYHVMRLLTTLLNRQQVKISLDRSLYYVYLRQQFILQSGYGPVCSSENSGKPLLAVGRQKCSYMDQIKN